MQIVNALIPGLSEYLFSLGDDEFILGHRDSEWCGRAPILEEDIAFANLALDEIGHAVLWYELLANLSDEDPQTFPDRIVYTRDESEYRCAQLVELPNGDWAFSMLRQYLFDEAEQVRLRANEESSWKPLADVAVRVRREENYHLRHTRAWVQRLGLGTEESHSRMQKALNDLWPYTNQLFIPPDGEEGLKAAGILPEAAILQAEWESRVLPSLAACSLFVPAVQPEKRDRSRHTPAFKTLLSELQSVAQMEPASRW